MNADPPPEQPIDLDTMSRTLWEELNARANALRRNERASGSLSNSMIVHEVWAEFAQSGRVSFNDRNHLLAAFGLAMSRFLVDRARARGRLKRGGDRRRVDWNAVEAAISEENDPDTLLDLADAIERLARTSGEIGSRYERLANLKLFSVMSNDQIAMVLGVSLGTVEKDWKYVKAQLGAAMSR